MRPFLLSIFLLLASFCQSFGQEYLPLIKKGRVSNVLLLSETNGPSVLPYQYTTLTTVLEKDTIINGLTYSIPQYRNRAGRATYISDIPIPFREDSVNRKIYFIHPVLQREVLYFDADADIGDTIVISRVHRFSQIYHISSQSRYENFSVIITAFDSINLGSNKLKATTFRAVEDTIRLRNNIFIEGFGFHFSLNPSTVFNWIFTYWSDNIVLLGQHPSPVAVTCISDPSGRLNYTNPQYDSCVINLESRWPLSTAKQIQEKALEVYPNPTAGELKVKGLETLASETAAVLIDAQGKTVWQGWLSAENATVPMSLQPRGLYLLQVGGQSIKVLKE